MKKTFPVTLLDLLRCEQDGGPLFTDDTGENLEHGTVQCGTCQQRYFIEGGILDLLGDRAPAESENRFELEVRESFSPTQRAREGWKPSWRDIAESNATNRRLEVARGATVLELGCGPGLYTRTLAQRCSQLLAVDFSRSALRENQRLLPSTSAQVGFVRSDVAVLRLAPRRFDVALTTLYSNLPDPDLRRSCNRHVAEALRPFGCYIVSTHHYTLRQEWGHQPRTGRYDNDIFFQRFSREQLKEELDAFDVQELAPVVFESPWFTRFDFPRLHSRIDQIAQHLPFLNRFGSILLATAIRR